MLLLGSLLGRWSGESGIEPRADGLQLMQRIPPDDNQSFIRSRGQRLGLGLSWRTAFIRA